MSVSHAGDLLVIVVPDSHTDLVERSLFGRLGTLRSDGAVQGDPVWFRWDGELLWFITLLAGQGARPFRAG
ncbi:hypothetical protein [Streptomyces sp. NPDC047028]|uniref:hypothetical protein n=1 Tax=Streptomyces sp. NPDC047028 TaxID=3155793 RepID=UPI0033CDBF6A